MPSRRDFDRLKGLDLYAVLTVGHRASFTELKKAYYRRAKECHPDRFPNDPAREAEFKLLVNAFDILSDPLKRRRYDEHLELTGQVLGAEQQAGAYADLGEDSVMDTVADDILEELIVGNNVPRDTTLQTIMRDLERTDKFIRFREGLNCLHRGNAQRAFRIFRLAAAESPENILYHYYMARAARRTGRLWTADRHLRHCLELGRRRMPPQRLLRVHRELRDLRRRQQGLLGRLVNLFTEEPRQLYATAEEELQAEMNREVRRLLRQRRQHQRANRPAAQLPPGDHDNDKDMA